MLPYIQITLPSYALLAAIGAFFALFFIYSRIERCKIEFTDMLRLCVIALVSVFIGSKALFVVTKLPEVFADFSLNKLAVTIATSGFVFYGGLLGAIAGLCIVTRKDKDYRKRVFTLFAPAFPLFHAFGRIGCFMAGCCYGKEVDPYFNLFGIVHFDRIPVQLFESAFEFLMFAAIIFIEKKNFKINTLDFFLLCYSVFRFCNEFFRGDLVRGIFFGLSTSQWVSIAIFVICVIRVVKRRSQKTDDGSDGGSKEESKKKSTNESKKISKKTASA